MGKKKQQNEREIKIKMRKQHFSALLQGVQGEKKAENFLCIIKSWAFPAWLRQPALFRAERTKADQIAGRESDGRHVSPMDECPGWSSPIPNHPRLSAPPVLGTGGWGRAGISSAAGPR